VVSLTTATKTTRPTPNESFPPLLTVPEGYGLFSAPRRGECRRQQQEAICRARRVCRRGTPSPELLARLRRAAQKAVANPAQATTCNARPQAQPQQQRQQPAAADSGAKSVRDQFVITAMTGHELRRNNPQQQRPARPAAFRSDRASLPRQQPRDLARRKIKSEIEIPAFPASSGRTKETAETSS